MSPTELQSHVEAYVSVREALGFRMQARRTLLREFIRFVEAHGDGGPIRASLALDWACAASDRRGGSGAANRLSVARGFLAYLRATVPETEVPDYNLLAAPRWRKPYLLTPKQVMTLMAAALEIGPRGALRPHTLSSVIGLLASTGLRAGEVMRLTVADVLLNEQPPHIYVRETKFHKSRLVPLHPSTATQLAAYAERRARLHYAGLSDTFFMSEKGRPLDYSSLSRWFARLCRQCHFWPDDDSRRPSLHSLRHGFAIERVRLWYQEGQDASALLPNLSVYLGHLGPRETFWYLTATPELLAAAGERFEHAARGGEL